MRVELFERGAASASRHCTALRRHLRRIRRTALSDDAGSGEATRRAKLSVSATGCGRMKRHERTNGLLRGGRARSMSWRTRRWRQRWFRRHASSRRWMATATARYPARSMPRARASMFEQDGCEWRRQGDGRRNGRRAARRSPAASAAASELSSAEKIKAVDQDQRRRPARPPSTPPPRAPCSRRWTSTATGADAEEMAAGHAAMLQEVSASRPKPASSPSAAAG